MIEGSFGLYVHWPFCAAKCPYCDFNSHVRRTVDAKSYVRAMVRELETLSARMDREVPLASIFFGGGTPSLMPPEGAGEVISAAARLFPFAADIEITLEANPTSSEAARFAAFAAAGVNRLSLGVQALNDADLKKLGRLHSAREARHALELAKAAFGRVSFDLIYAREGQSLAAWEDELGSALSLAADHLSLYQLTIEDGTPFAALHQAGKLHVPDSDTAALMFERTAALTEAAGLPAYEVSNHARPGAESRHNLVYWRGGAFLGIGPGAHGRLAIEGTRRATVTERQPEAWLARVERHGHGLVSDDVVTQAALAEEYLLMGLRLREGVSLARYEALAGGALDAAQLAALGAAGFVSQSGDRLSATAAGRLVLNRLVAELSA